jgi:hypothetical protein
LSSSSSCPRARDGLSPMVGQGMQPRS